MIKTVSFGSVKDVGVGDSQIFNKNFKEIDARIKNSQSTGFFIEAISLQLQLIDLWLRELVKEKTGKQYVFGGIYKFGAIIKNSKQLLTPHLYSKIDTFNSVRIEAIHNFIYGSADYAAIEKVAKKFNSLHSEVFQFVVKKISKEKPSIVCTRAR